MAHVWRPVPKGWILWFPKNRKKCWSTLQNCLMSLQPLVAIELPSYLLDVPGDHELARRVKRSLYMSKLFCWTWRWYIECLMSVWKVLLIALSWYGVLTYLGFVLPWTCLVNGPYRSRRKVKIPPKVQTQFISVSWLIINHSKEHLDISLVHSG